MRFMNSFLLCVEFSWREMNAWSPGLVSGVTMEPGTAVSGQKCRQQYPGPASLAWILGDGQVVTLLVHFSHTSANACPAFRSKHVRK